MNRLFATTLHSPRMAILLLSALLGFTWMAHNLTSNQAHGAPPPPPLPMNPGPSIPGPSGPVTLYTSAAGGPVTFEGKLDRSTVLMGGDDVVKMELVLAAAPDQPGTQRTNVRRATDFVVVLDRSGSMGGDKIDHARAAVRELITELGEKDRFALVAYSSAASTTIPLRMASSQAKRDWLKVINSTTASGGTNMSAGLDLALGISKQTRNEGRATRLVLISDGLANEGDASPEGLKARATRSARQEAVLSTVGIGEDFDEFLMSSLADAGTGNFYYLQNLTQLAEVFNNEFGATRETVASALAVTIQPGPGVTVVDAAGYPLERVGNRVVFRPGSLFAGQTRRVWLTLKVPNHELSSHSLGTFLASYSQGNKRGSLEFSDMPRIACIADQEKFIDSVDEDTWARATVEEDYSRLQQQVAGYVKNGNKKQALREITAYELSKSELNRSLDNDQVTANLSAVGKLKSEVNEVFEGEHQAERQNLLSKSRQASGWDGRRVGSKKKSAITPQQKAPQEVTPQERKKP